MKTVFKEDTIFVGFNFWQVSYLAGTFPISDSRSNLKPVEEKGKYD